LGRPIEKWETVLLTSLSPFFWQQDFRSHCRDPQTKRVPGSGVGDIPPTHSIPKSKDPGLFLADFDLQPGNTAHSQIKPQRIECRGISFTLTMADRRWTDRAAGPSMT
jgi:hypothetical protein